MKTARGGVLLELVLALVVVALILGATGQVLKVSVSGLAVARKSNHYANVLQQIRIWLQIVGNDIDSYPFQIPPRLHRAGNIRYTDGSLHGATQFTAGRAPLESSDALSALRIDTLSAGLILSVEDSVALVCQRFERGRWGPSRNHFLVVQTSGFSVFTGTVVSHTGRSDCWDVELKAAKSLVVDSSLDDHVPVPGALVLPIDREYTIFVNRRHELRYLSNQGSRIAEHQPIGSGVEELHVSLRDRPERNRLLLHASGKLDGGRAFSAVATHALVKAPFYTFLLGRW